MDTTSLQQTHDTLKAQESSLQEQLTATQQQIAVVEEQLSIANQVNALEALSPDQVVSLNAALTSDAQNTSGITLTLPPAKTEQAQESQPPA